MAPITPDLTNSNLRPLSLLASYILLTASITGLVGYNILYRAFKALPPSQDTRHRKSNRDKHVQIFSALSIISLATSCFQMTRYLNLSYCVWAHEVGQRLPSSYEDVSQLSLGRWMHDTSFYVDAWEVAVERSRRFWWSQQLLLCLGAWFVFVGLEGRRRNIRHLWAFPLLSQLVSVSFAMNVFFLAILLTAIPLPARSSARKETADNDDDPVSQLVKLLRTLQTYLPPLPTRPHPAGWTPSPLSFIPSLVVAHIATFILPFATSTTTFTPLLTILILLPYRLIYPDRLGPIAYGSTTLHRNYTGVYQYISYASLFLYLKQTFVAVLDNDPGAHEHRHSQYLAALHLPHSDSRTTLSRSSSAVGKVLGAVRDHPFMVQIGTEVLLCMLSLCCWAVVRGLDIKKIMVASGVPSPALPVTASATTSATPPVRARKRKSTVSDSTPSSIKKSPGRDLTFRSENEAAIPHGEEEETENAEAGAVSGVLFVLGGLGVLTAGVLGAETVY